MSNFYKLLSAFTFILFCEAASAIAVDSLKLYTQYYTADSSEFFLIAHVKVSSMSCSVKSVNVTYPMDTIVATICYVSQANQVQCPRTDTFALGVKKNGIINVRGIFQEFHGNQCKGNATIMGLHIKDTFDLTINTIYSNIAPNSNIEDEFTIAPNPTNYKLHCSVNGLSSNSSIQITTIEGKIVLTGILVTQSNFDIDVSTLPTGIYFLQLSDAKQRVVKKFVKC